MRSKPVKSTPIDSSANGERKIAEMGMLMTAMDRIKSKALDALENVAEPRSERPVQRTRAAVCRP